MGKFKCCASEAEHKTARKGPTAVPLVSPAGPLRSARDSDLALGCVQQQFWLARTQSQIIPQMDECIQLCGGTMPSTHDTAGREARIHLVSSTPPPRPHEKRLTLGEYTADIVISKREENCCYYVIQRVGSAEILEMQRFSNSDDAEAFAQIALRRWNQEKLLRRTAI